MDPEIFTAIYYGFGLIIFFFLIAFGGLVLWAVVDNYRYAKECKRLMKQEDDAKVRRYDR